MTVLWMSCTRFTVRVTVSPSTGRVVDAAPVVRRFIGQDVERLRAWLRKFGGYMETQW